MPVVIGNQQYWFLNIEASTTQLVRQHPAQRLRIVD